MNRITAITLTWFFASGYCAFGQFPVNDLYQYNYTSISPAFAGLDGQKITFIGSTFQASKFPGPDSGFMGFETTIKKINSGVGFNAITEQSGPVSSTYLSLLYNYQWNIGDERTLVFGAKLGSYALGVNLSQYIPVDNNDPLLNSPGDASTTNLMAGAGVLYKGKRFFAGISADNLAHRKVYSDPYINFSPDNILFHYFLGTNVDLGKSFSTTHSIYSYTIENDWRADLNNAVIFRKWLIAGVSFQFDDNGVMPKANAGVSIKDKAKVLVMLYSKERDVERKFSGQLLLQFSL